MNENIAKFKDEHNASDNEIAVLTRKNADPVVRRVMAEELRPIVREALTEDVLRSMSTLVQLTPSAVAALQDDLNSPSASIRQRAYMLVMKYTIGHPALVKPDDTDPTNQMTVNVNLPRPEQAAVDAPALEDDEEDDGRRVCDLCGEAKPEDEFVADSERCLSCVQEWKAKVQEQFG